MGWDYCHNTTREKTVAEHIVPFTSCGGNKVTPIAYADHNGVLWVLHHIDLKEGGSKRCILCVLIEGGGRSWGVKLMGEYTGPYYYDCPLDLIGLAGEPSMYVEQTLAWREKVRQYHQENAAKGCKPLNDVVMMA